MTTHNLTFNSESWVDIVTELSLVNDTEYTLQNVGSMEFFLVESALEPTNQKPHIINPNMFASITPEAGTTLWVKSSIYSSTIAVTESQIFKVNI